MTVDISAQLHARNRFNVIFATWQSGFICPVINKNRAKNGTGCVFVGPRTRNQTNAAWSGLRPDTPPTSHAARLKSVSVRRFMTRQTENRRYSRVCASTSRASLCQNVKVTHIRNNRNIRVYDNNCTQRRQKIAHIFSKK